MRGSRPRGLSPRGPPSAPGLVLRAAMSSLGPAWEAPSGARPRAWWLHPARPGRSPVEAAEGVAIAVALTALVPSGPARPGRATRPTSDGLSSARQGSASWLPNPRLHRRKGVASCPGALRTGALTALGSAEASVHPGPPQIRPTHPLCCRGGFAKVRRVSSRSGSARR